MKEDRETLRGKAQSRIEGFLLSDIHVPRMDIFFRGLALKSQWMLHRREGTPAMGV